MAKLCPQLLANGTCADTACSYRHDLHSCDLCGVVCPNASILANHINGKRHRAKISGNNNILHCSVCDRNVLSMNWESHISGKAHIRAANRKGVSATVEGEQILTDVPGQRFCDICQIHVAEQSWSIHTRGRNHKRLENYRAMSIVFDEAARDKNGITVEGPFDFDIIEPALGAAGAKLGPKISLTIPQSKISLVEVKLASAGRSGTLSPYVFIFYLRHTPNCLPTLQFHYRHRWFYRCPEIRKAYECYSGLQTITYRPIPR